MLYDLKWPSQLIPKVNAPGFHGVEKAQAQTIKDESWHHEALFTGVQNVQHCKKRAHINRKSDRLNTPH